MSFTERRERQLVERAIAALDLDLSGLTVLTEAATGHFRLTPVIAALAGAASVLALTRDSRYATAETAIAVVRELASRWELGERITFLDGREDPRLAEADVVTNLGFVRPLDAQFLERLSSNVVIPLMWETWEYREADLDLAAARRLRIPVLGTNEAHPLLRTQEFLGPVAMKLLLEAGIEVLLARIIVLGADEFARHVAESLEAAGAVVTRLPDLTVDASAAVAVADAIVIADHHRAGPLLGGAGQLSGQEIAAANPAVLVAHIAGVADREGLVEAGVACVPDRFAPKGFMSVATDYAGPKPLIDLHTAGLKVGELMRRARARRRSALAIELAVLRESALAQGFAGIHYRSGH